MLGMRTISTKTVIWRCFKISTSKLELESLASEKIVYIWFDSKPKIYSYFLGKTFSTEASHLNSTL